MSGLGKIGIVGGAGWLGGAIAESLVNAGVVIEEDLALSYRSTRPDRFLQAFWTVDNQELADRSDIIFLSVRPADWRQLRIDAKGKLVISVMAGVSLAALCHHHNTPRVVRALPNAAAEVALSYTPWIATQHATGEDKAAIRAIFDACGMQDEVASEGDIDYLTGLSGAGPAFPALLATAMLKDAIARGLEPKVAHRAVNAVLVGTGGLLQKRDENPDDIVRTFLDYRGTTAAAIEEMRASGFDTAVQNGLSAAFAKSIKMGQIS
ncbi:NAD(P)-binding domain-containing protein (plasmid) [Rhizobium sp. CB3060]|uniref:pyrroline-5-carboxylate reductase family protein n=1 Tax=Rhizobium sp. CB3060 TaxID=3138255 RepID=UPI0021A646E4|nr:pyrroline-5-carboxylate reductase dimerization domain-containing protein [Rhizobium tropici]UWU24577.1 NAD(P)-binding domain-containing protein [Rhizobium tropici]